MSTQDTLTSFAIAENHESWKQSISDSEDMDTSADHPPPVGSSNEDESEDQEEPSSPQDTPRKSMNSKKLAHDRYPGLSRRPSLSVATNTGDISVHTTSLIDHVLPDEEPSSALGKRIFSAQSNPSPPPSPLLSGGRARLSLVDIDTGSDEPTTPEAVVSTHESEVTYEVSPFASSTHLDLNVDFRPHAGPSFMLPKPIDPTANLISFDSPDKPAAHSSVIDPTENLISFDSPDRPAIHEPSDIHPTADLISFDSPVRPAVHDSVVNPLGSLTEVDQEHETTVAEVLGEPQEPSQTLQVAMDAAPSDAEVATPNTTPRLRRSARLSATPQSTLPPLGQKSVTLRPSPLKQSSIDEDDIAAAPGSLPRPRALKIVKKSTQPGLDPFSMIASSSSALGLGRTRRKGRVRSTSPMPATENQPSVDPAPIAQTDMANSGKRVRRRERGTHIADDSVAPLSPGSAGVLQSMFSDVQTAPHDLPRLMLPINSDPTPEVAQSSDAQKPETPQRSKSLFPTRPNQLVAGSQAVRSPARVPSPIRSQPNLPPNSPMKAMAALEAYPQPPLRRVVPDTDDKAPGTSGTSNSHRLPRLGSGGHKLARVVPSKSPPQPSLIEPVTELAVTSDLLEDDHPLASVADSSVRLPHPVLPSRIPSPSKARLRTPSDSSDGNSGSGVIKPGLRQGSTSASRIPRMASKPYSRMPPVKKPASDDITSKIPVNYSTPSIDGQQNSHATVNIQAVEVPTSPALSSLKRKRTSNASLQPITSQMDQMSVVAEASSAGPSKLITSLGNTTEKPARATAGSRRVTSKTTYPEYVEVDGGEVTTVAPPVMSADSTAIPIPVVPVATFQDVSAAEANAEQDVQDPPLRRTARSKRSVVRTAATSIPTTGTPRPPPRPRRAAPEISMFGGMTRTAIEALSQKHTDQNSTYYYAILARALVKRPGNRPESPGMKIRTIAQRQAEEAERGRSERAERRARRSGDDMEDDAMEDDVLPALDITPLEHVLGAGEDMPFTTPPKSEHATKRARFGNNENLPCKKGVKWNKGLFTVAFIDDIEVKEHKARREDFQGPGCLAPKAKALQLDSLGNLLSVSVPLGNLGSENITVQKFVYEDDEVAQVVIPEPEPVAPPPPPPPPAKKVTRARKKT